ncbi:sodium:solute symporter family protein [Rickettsia endosymbiont of Cardiosporidium cionae]|uniref:sodium:solute symporter family protein n=1 Tax=Rickettsia endosymbiont of Cardiosporidium cionae TaxID=2777155 RepID=UPI0018937106|nr:hypothetical protein [Rickettsia endosymbiont of Cardiosporidium cionae]KAF8818589.1 hypothetical protein IHI24_000307 [Rickettsia endosymbiont of Cardiosporidium cionae]
MKFELGIADLLVISVFVIAMFYVVLTVIFRVKSFKEFALGSRVFSTPVLVATIVATYLSGSGFFIELSCIYEYGIAYFISDIAIVISFIIFGIFFVPRMQIVLGSISIAEAISKIYGNNVRYLISVSSILSSIGSIAAQFSVFSKIFEYFTGIDPKISIIFSAILIIVYSAFGGIRSVIYTDVLQFIAFSITIMIISALSFQYICSSTTALDTIKMSNKFNLLSLLDMCNASFWEMVNLSLFFGVKGLSSNTIIHRIIVAGDLSKMRKVILYSSVVLIIFSVLIVIIPVSIFSIEQDLNPDNIISTIIGQYSFFLGISGILITGIVALSISTADSHINSAAVTFANDLLPSSCFRYKLLAAKLFSLILGSIGVVIALYENNLLKIILLTKGFYLVIAVPVIIITVLGFRTHKNIVLLGMGLGLSTMILFKHVIQVTFDPSVISFFITISFILVIGYLFKFKVYIRK